MPRKAPPPFTVGLNLPVGMLSNPVITKKAKAGEIQSYVKALLEDDPEMPIQELENKLIMDEKQFRLASVKQAFRNRQRELGIIDPAQKQKNSQMKRASELLRKAAVAPDFHFATFEKHHTSNGGEFSTYTLRNAYYKVVKPELLKKEQEKNL